MRTCATRPGNPLSVSLGEKLPFEFKREREVEVWGFLEVRAGYGVSLFQFSTLCWTDRGSKMALSGFVWAAGRKLEAQMSLAFRRMDYHISYSQMSFPPPSRHLPVHPSLEAACRKSACSKFR